MALYRGIGQSVAGLSLSRMDTDHPEIELKYLPAFKRAQVENRIVTDGRDKARERIAELAVQASACKKQEERKAAKAVNSASTGPALTREEQAVAAMCEA
ncbi:hypothetical protein [Streptomyces sp. NPDC050504]|uniref:hypothetical protein n=1 Tax=Streptomyces sp. NPDC050504 TaxID=3365618 RepID=UPI003790E696